MPAVLGSFALERETAFLRTVEDFREQSEELRSTEPASAEEEKLGERL